MCCLSRISSRFIGQPSNINIHIGSCYEFYYELNSSCLHLWIITVSHIFAMTYLNCHTAEHCMYLHTLSYGRRRSFLFSFDKTMLINSRCSLKPWAGFQPMGPWTWTCKMNQRMSRELLNYTLSVIYFALICFSTLSVGFFRSMA